MGFIILVGAVCVLLFCVGSVVAVIMGVCTGLKIARIKKQEAQAAAQEANRQMPRGPSLALIGNPQPGHPHDTSSCMCRACTDFRLHTRLGPHPVERCPCPQCTEARNLTRAFTVKTDTNQPQ